jgi:hypothetical protein
LHVVVAGDFAHVLQEPGGAAGAAAAGGTYGRELVNGLSGLELRWISLSWGGRLSGPIGRGWDMIGRKEKRRGEESMALLTASEDDPFDVCFVGEFVSGLREEGG